MVTVLVRFTRGILGRILARITKRMLRRMLASFTTEILVTILARFTRGILLRFLARISTGILVRILVRITTGILVRMLGRIIKGILERILERSITAIFVTVLARFAMGFLITILEGILQRITTGILLESWLGLSSCFYSGERLFFVLEYGKTHFPGIYCFKKRLGKMAIFWPKPWVNPFGKILGFRLCELVVFVSLESRSFSCRIS